MSPESGGALAFGELPRPPAGGGTAFALAEPAVSCTGVTYRFGDHVAVDHVDLTIQPGETFGLLGPNGAGKTTTIRMLVTLLKPMKAGSACSARTLPPSRCGSGG
jgi:ABC-type uncharacterized transport system ATPase subunit